MPFAEDLSVFFGADDFGTEASYFSPAAPLTIYTLNGIFREPSRVADVAEVGVRSLAPTFTYAESDATPVTGWTLQIGLNQWDVVDYETADGIATLILQD